MQYNLYYILYNPYYVIYTVYHRFELNVLCYQGFRLNYPYPFLGIILMVILHGFIIQNYY